MATTELFELDLNPVNDASIADFVIGEYKYHVEIFKLWECVNKLDVSLNENADEFFKTLRKEYESLFDESPKTFLGKEEEPVGAKVEFSLEQVKLVHSAISTYVAQLFKKKSTP